MQAMNALKKLLKGAFVTGALSCVGATAMAAEMRKMDERLGETETVETKQNHNQYT